MYIYIIYIFINIIYIYTYIEVFMSNVCILMQELSFEFKLDFK